MRNFGRYVAVAGLVAYFGACTGPDRNFGSNGTAAAGQQNSSGGSNAGGTGTGGSGPVAGSAPIGMMVAAKVPCKDTADCDDKNRCNGVEICAGGFCAAEGVDQANGTACPASAPPLGAAGAAGQSNTPASGSFCTAGSCVPGRCGDGYTDALVALEQCDDANDLDGDGCDKDCTFTCSADSDCKDSDPCNGTEVCDLTTHVCKAGTPVADADNLMCGVDKNCRSGQCVLVGCGNGTLEGAEECDDGNNVDKDGCQADCKWTCKVNADCDDGNACTGVEVCNTSTPKTPLCVAGNAIVCDDRDACTADTCDPTAGACGSSLIDGDGDGEAPAALGMCGSDCNDADKEIGGKQQEVCGDMKDNDCNPNTVDDTRTQYFLDCDGDGFAERGAAWVLSCELPSPSGTCALGLADKWTTRAPNASDATDCYDANPHVRPSQTSFKSTYISGVPASVDFDYNCNDVEQPKYTAVNVPLTATCKELSGSCVGTDGWVNAAGPACGDPGSFSECGCASGVIIGLSQVTRAAVIGPILGCTYGCARTSVKRLQSCL